MARLYNIPPRYVARWLATHLTGGERGVPMKDDRLRVARLCRVPTQRSLLGASRFLRLGRCVDSTFRPGRFLGPQRARARLHSRCDFVFKSWQGF